MYNLGNLTIILPSYNCDRNCPFCIAKNNRKFNSDKDLDLESLVKALNELRLNNIHFDRVVLSGKGEPSLYSYEQLESCAAILKNNSDLFDVLRVHTSGNIFFEESKFNLFNQLLPLVEFDILRVAVDAEKDMQILGYSRDYTQTQEFKKAKSIKFDIGLTNQIDPSTFVIELDNMLKTHNNIHLIRFKNLMSGEHKDSMQARWVEETKMNKDDYFTLVRNILSCYNRTKPDDLTLATGQRIVFEKSGNYPKDAVYSNSQICDYSEKPLSISDLKNMASIVDKTKALEYDD